MPTVSEGSCRSGDVILVLHTTAKDVCQAADFFIVLICPGPAADPDVMPLLYRKWSAGRLKKKAHADCGKFQSACVVEVIRMADV
jgi:hypothetical protein